MSEARKKAKGLLDPVNQSSQLPPANIPSPSNYLPTNSSVGTGYNTLAQVLAHGISPGISGDQGYYHRADFRRPDGKMSGMAQYAPQLQSGREGAWGQSRWQDWLRGQGVGQAGNSQRLGNGTPETTPGTTPGTGPGNMSGWLQWLQTNYPGINFGAIMNGSIGGNSVNAPPIGDPRMTMGRRPEINFAGANMGWAAVPPDALNTQLQALIQSINRVEK